jgi:HEAT repeat protein
MARKILARIATKDELLSLLHHENWQVRLASVESLDTQGEVQDLIPFLNDPARQVRRAAVLSLAGSYRYP